MMSDCLYAVPVVVVVPVDVGGHITGPGAHVLPRLPADRPSNPPVAHVVRGFDPFDVADPAGDAAQARESFAFDRVGEVAASGIVRPPQLRRVAASLGVEPALRDLVQ